MVGPPTREVHLRLGPFQLTERIGQGGMGEVWAASHAHGGRVAVKILSAEALRDMVYRSAFRNEVRSVAALRHPHIIRVFEHGEVTDAEARQGDSLVSGMSYLAMELAAGGSLASRRGRLSWTEQRAVLDAMLDALAHAHARGVVHRDLKPDNVLLGREVPSIKLTDFGLAHAVDRSFPWRASSTAGTPSYMAPEQFVGEWRDFGPWTDLYALACVGWTLATGHPPFRTASRKDAMDAHLGRDPGALDAKVPVPEGYETWLRWLLQKDLKYRPASAAEAAWGLRALPDVGGGPPKMRRDGPARAIPEALRKTALSWDGALLPARSRASAPPFPEDWREGSPDDPPHLAGTGLGLFGLRAAPFVGREAERDALWRALRRVWTENRPGAVLLRGQPGSGKSRLARWLQERAAELGVATPLSSVHSPMSPGRAGLERMIARWFRAVGLSDADIAYRVRVALTAWGEPDPVESQAFVDVISAWAHEGTHPVESATAGHRATVIRRFLERVSADRPIVLVLEDVQWGREALEVVEEHLVRGVKGPAVLFVLTWREDFAGYEETAALVERVRRDPYALDVPVQALPAAATRQLVDGLLDLEPSLAAEVSRRAEGNPLFAVQLLTDWVDREALEATTDGYRLRSGADAMLPDDLHQLWVERLDRLFAGRPARDREAMELAAALGLEVDVSEWAETCAEAGIAAPLDLVERMLDQGLAVRASGGSRWGFAHGMLRESLERLAREANRDTAHHRLCAVVLRRRGGPFAGERLGRHLLAAGQAEQALTLLLDAARNWARRGEHASAEALLGEIDRAIAAASLPGGDRRRVEAWMVRARVDALRGQHTQAARWARLGIAAADAYGWKDLRAQGLVALGWSFHVLGHPEEAASFLADGVVAAEAGSDEETLADALARQAEACRVAGDLSGATAAWNRALGLWKGRGSGAARCLLGLGSLARMEGDLETARVRLSHARALFGEQGEPRGVANAASNLADVARQQGRLEEAIDLSREALSLFEEQDVALSAHARLNYALALIASDRDDMAWEELRRCVVALHKQGWRALVGVARLAMLRRCGALGEWEEWDRHLSAGAEILEHARLHDPDVPWLLEIAGIAAREAGEKVRARRALEIAFDQWTGLGRLAEARAVERRLMAG